MARTIIPGQEETHLPAAVEAFQEARSVVAFTGAGISVESGIPDFRSPGGLWTEFPPEEYATLDVFLRDPAKAWRLYRAVGKKLQGKQPNPAHHALVGLEQAGRLDLIVTQNVDGLHQAAGSGAVLEVHGDHRHVQCLRCDWLGPVQPEQRADSGEVPECPECRHPLKPNVVLFGEGVREMEAASEAMRRCDLLLVVGTSAQVYPAAGLPAIVKEHGGLIFEFNQEETTLTRGAAGGGWSWLLGGTGATAVQTDFLFLGPASRTLSLLAEAVLG